MCARLLGCYFLFVDVADDKAHTYLELEDHAEVHFRRLAGQVEREVHAGIRHQFGVFSQKVIGATQAGAGAREAVTE